MLQMSPLKRALTALRWTRHSSILLSGFLLSILLIIYVWWPLAEDYLSYIDWHGRWWLYIDWLLIGIFAFISVTIMARADLRTDTLIVCVGILGGLAIESWGTQTNLWFYYTSERPPLWIIPAWPIAALAIDRLARALSHLTTKTPKHQDPKKVFFVSLSLRDFVVKFFYWTTFGSFLALMVLFVAPTFDKPYTILSLLLCIGVTLTPTDHRFALLTFMAGAGLGYFLELWGTTRQCWTYYTYETPPLFAVLAHGMAAVVFWRTGLLMRMIARALPARAVKSPVSE
jgi:hypothetical protein